MKIPALKKQIIRNCSIMGALAVVFTIIYYYYSSEKNSVESKIDKIDSDTTQINVELSDLQSKTAEIKKYRDLWRTISENKKNISAIKADEINAKLNSIATKYGIGGQNIKLSLPEVVRGGVFERNTVNIMMTVASITFTAANDVKAVMFVNEFINSLRGYPIVTSFSININKDYDNNDLIDLSTGKSQGLVSGKVDFFWYVYKESEKKDEKVVTPENEVLGAPGS